MCLVKSVLRAHAAQPLLPLPLPREVTNTKQYKLPGDHKETTTIIREMAKRGIIRPTDSPFDSPVWPAKISSGT